jgi:hypothetical protein
MNRAITKIGWLLLATGLAGCGGGMVSHVRDDVDYSHIQRVAVYPFLNRSQDQLAAARVQTVFITELATRGGLQIIDPGETLAAMRDLRYDAAADLSAAQIIELGKRLSVDAVFFGAVDDYGFERENANRAAAVTLSMRLAETQTGTVIWLSQDHRTGTSVWRKLFGGGSASLHDVTRAVVTDCLGSLF